jgi:hypothetical protein
MLWKERRTYTAAHDADKQRATSPPPEPGGVTLGLQRAGDFLQDRRIVDRGRHLVGLAIGDLPHRAAQDLARAGLRQPVDDHHRLEGRDRADLLAHQRDQLFFELLRACRPRP